MEIKTIAFYDAATDEITEREMNAEELQEHNQIQMEAEQQESDRIAKAAARESALAKLAELGLTAEEIAAL
jgi:hypothetical protein